MGPDYEFYCVFKFKKHEYVTSFVTIRLKAK